MRERQPEEHPNWPFWYASAKVDTLLNTNRNLNRVNVWRQLYEQNFRKPMLTLSWRRQIFVYIQSKKFWQPLFIILMGRYKYIFPKCKHALDTVAALARVSPIQNRPSNSKWTGCWTIDLHHRANKVCIWTRRLPEDFWLKKPNPAASTERVNYSESAERSAPPSAQLLFCHCGDTENPSQHFCN